MSRIDKLLARLLSMPKDFTWAEVQRLLGAKGFEPIKGKTGSRRGFRHADTGAKVLIHEPHPEPHLKRYAIEEIIGALRDAGELP